MRPVSSLSVRLRDIVRNGAMEITDRLMFEIILSTLVYAPLIGIRKELFFIWLNTDLE